MSAKSWLESRQKSGRLAGVAKWENASVRKHGVQAAIFGKKVAASVPKYYRAGIAHRQVILSSRQLWTCRCQKISTFVLKTFYLSVAAMSFKTR